MMPAGFDVGGFDVEDFLGEFSFLAMGDVDDAALGVDARQGHGEGPGEDEVAEGAEVEYQDIAPGEHDHRY